MLIHFKKEIKPILNEIKINWLIGIEIKIYLHKILFLCHSHKYGIQIISQLTYNLFSANVIYFLPH